MEILKGTFSFPAKCYRKNIKTGAPDYNKTLHLFDFIFKKIIPEMWRLYEAISTVMMSKFKKDDHKLFKSF